MSQAQNRTATPKSYDAGLDQSGIRQFLHRNEGGCVFDSSAEATALLDLEQIRRYPDYQQLCQRLAALYGVPTNRLVITAGGDQAIESTFRLAAFEAGMKADSAAERIQPNAPLPNAPLPDAALPNRESLTILTHEPCFEMFDVYARNLQAALETVDWLDDEFPSQKILDRLKASRDGTAPGVDLIVLCSPNNPTGRSIPLEAIRDICHAAHQQGTRVLLDQAYLEFSDELPQPATPIDQLENVVRVRTLSKAWGLAGLRIGCAITNDVELAQRLRAMNGPFPLSSASVAIACRALDEHAAAMRSNVQSVRQYRDLLTQTLESASLTVLPSHANFLLVLVDPDSGLTAIRLNELLADHGIAVRRFAGRRLLENALRLTIPPDLAGIRHLLDAIGQILKIDVDAMHEQLPVAAKGSTPSPVHSNFALAQTQDQHAMNAPPDRCASVQRKTRETEIEVHVNLDGSGQSSIATGLGFFDHMLTALACHSRMDIRLSCQGDLQVDDHHTIEDCGLAVGEAIAKALGEKRGINRFASQYAPLDESLVRVVIDLSGRAASEVHLDFARQQIGAVATENLCHFFESFANALGCALHVDTIRGKNDHHKAEAAFKALALALRHAVGRDGRLPSDSVPSTKGVLA